MFKLRGMRLFCFFACVLISFLFGLNVSAAKEPIYSSVAVMDSSSLSIGASQRDYFDTLALKQAIEEVIMRSVGRNGKSGVLIQMENNKTIFELNPNEILKPASNLKLVTTAVALELLTPDYRTGTHIYANGTLENGVLEGDIVIVGGADPVISGQFYGEQSDIVKKWANIIITSGIKEIKGEVVLDNSFYWNDVQASNQESVKPIYLFTVANFRNANQSQLKSLLRTRYVTRKGKRIRIVYQPRKKLKKMSFQPNYKAAEMLLMELKRLHVINEAKDNNIALLTEIPDYQNWQHVHTEWSEPLFDMISTTNKFSDNFYADQILRMVGYEIEGYGIMSKGVNVVKRFMYDRMHIDTSDIVIEDGSGLSHKNKISATALMQVLQYMLQKSPFVEPYSVSLATPGEAGTLVGRMSFLEDDDSAANIRAKTGSITGVVSLSGYVTSKSGYRFSFVILNNQARQRRKSVRRLKGMEDTICKILSSI